MVFGLIFGVRPFLLEIFNYKPEASLKSFSELKVFFSDYVIFEGEYGYYFVFISKLLQIRFQKYTLINLYKKFLHLLIFLI